MCKRDWETLSGDLGETEKWGIRKECRKELRARDMGNLNRVD